MARPAFKIIEVTQDNVEDMYCSRSKRKENGYQNKAKWIRERFKEGLRYWSLLVDEHKKGGRYSYRGMIEAMPGEKCWRGVDAPKFMVIHCIWVVGKHKKQGYGTKLLEKVIESAKKSNMDGVAVMTIREKKGGWSPKPGLFERNNFKIYDSVLDTFDLYAIKFKKNPPDPKFFPITKISKGNIEGTHVFVSYQCPYMVNTIESLKTLTKEEYGADVHVHEMSACEDVRKNGYHPYGTFHIIHEGHYITHLPGGMRDIQIEFNKYEKKEK